MHEKFLKNKTVQHEIIYRIIFHGVMSI